MNEATPIKRETRLQEVWRRIKKNKLAFAGLITISLIIFMVCFADLFTNYDAAITMDFSVTLSSPTKEHIFGTDCYGRDLFARCLYGGRISLFISICAALLGMTIGGFLGMVSGYSNNVVDNVIMRFMDIIASIPATLLALAIVAAIGSGIPNLIVAMVCSRIPIFARVVRSSVLSVCDQEYIEAAKAGGTSYFRIIRKHILPNVIGPLIVQTTMQVSVLILDIASLSFLGLGVAAPRPEWGGLVSEAKEYIMVSPYLIIIPSMLILISSLSINLFGDGLRDALDPKLRS